jgi:hypothetical protein
MATVTQRTWKVPGQRTRRKAWGYVGVEDSKHRTDCSSAECRGCRQVRMFKSEWSREDAEKALAEFKLKIVQPTPTRASITFAEAVERYLAAKARKKSRDEDARLLGHLMTYFGKDTPISEITAGRISEYRGHRLALVRKIGDGERRLAAATINRPLALLRHLLRLARHPHDPAGARAPRPHPVAGAGRGGPAPRCLRAVTHQAPRRRRTDRNGDGAPQRRATQPDVGAG